MDLIIKYVRALAVATHCDPKNVRQIYKIQGNQVFMFLTDSWILCNVLPKDLEIITHEYHEYLAPSNPTECFVSRSKLRSFGLKSQDPVDSKILKAQEFISKYLTDWTFENVQNYYQPGAILPPFQGRGYAVITERVFNKITCVTDFGNILSDIDCNFLYENGIFPTHIINNDNKIVEISDIDDIGFRFLRQQDNLANVKTYLKTLNYIGE